MEEIKKVLEETKITEDIEQAEKSRIAVDTVEKKEEIQKTEEEVTEESIIKFIKEEAKEENDIGRILKSSSSANITSFKDRVTGNVNSGNGTMNIYNLVSSEGKSELFQLKITEEEVHKIKEVYEQIPEYFDAKGKLREHNIIILYNEINTGKRTTSLKLLSEFPYVELSEIGLTSDLKSLTEFDFKGSNGYFIDGIAFEHMNKINEAYLKKLSMKLKEINSRLVITYNNNHLERKELSSFTICCSRPRDTINAVINHLYCEIQDDSKREKMIEILKAEDFSSALISVFKLNDIKNLIYGLESIADGKSDKNRVLDSLSLSISKQVKDWFKTHSDIEDWCFLIALAVFENRQYDEVMEAAVALRREICNNQPGASIQTNLALLRTREDWLTLLNGRLKKAQKNTEMGRVDITLIEFDKPGMAEAILKYVWMNYDYLKKPLIEWLIEYSSFEKLDLDAKVADAVSHLIKVDLVGIKENYIMPCAKDDNPYSRLSAAMVLDSMVQQKELAGYALSLLHNWSSVKNKELMWTAAAAYGLSAGLIHPDRAFKDFINIIKYKDFDIFEILSISIDNLFDWSKEFPDFYGKILDALIQWSNNEDKWVSINSLFIFLELSLRKTVKSKGKNFPKILALAVQDDSLKEQIINLWKSAFNETRTRELAEYALRRWMSLGDEEEGFYSYVEYFTMSLYKSMADFEKKRLRYFVEKWTISQKESLISARMILPQLAGK